MRSDRVRLLDILDAIDVIEKYLPTDVATFLLDPPVQSHIHRHLAIIGEPVWRLTDELKRTHAQVPWRQIEGMRHVLVHDYFKVDWNRVFETARNHVPPLRPQVVAILGLLPADPPA